jgi:hypothetical protein
MNSYLVAIFDNAQLSSYLFIDLEEALFHSFIFKQTETLQLFVVTPFIEY